MPTDTDKYPAESGRRRFVKGVAGSAALSSVGATGVVTLEATTGPKGTGGGRIEFFGIENTDGPAPRGMPIVPIEISDGELRGVEPALRDDLTEAEIEEGFNGSGVPYTFAWFQYCGIQSSTGLNPERNADNYLRASDEPYANYEWQQNVEGGTVLTLDMFDDYEEWGNGIGRPGIGKPAIATWRSEPKTENEEIKVIPVQVLRSPRVSKMVDGKGQFSEFSDSVRTFLEAATAENCIAWLNKCTHFCCAPGFKHLTGSAKFDAENEVYCGCHQSVYDPFSVVRRSFVALPRPN